MAAKVDSVTDAGGAASGALEVRVRCVHCKAEYWDEPPPYPLPALDDDDAWDILEGLHKPACTWVWTRGFRRPSPLRWGSKA